MTAFTGSVSDFLTGSVPDSTTLGYVTDALQGLTDPWTSWSIAWTASGTAPALGNATTNCSYLQAGKLVIAKFVVTFGSTSTYGTGTYSFSLPATAAGTTYGLGVAWALDASANTRNVMAVAQNSATTFQLQAHGQTATVGQTVPWTWANGDYFRGVMVYEAA